MKENKRLDALPLLGSLAFLILGLILLIWPAKVIIILPVLIGLVLVLVGVQGLAHTLVMHKRIMQPGYKAMQALVNLIIGCIFLVKQDISLLFLSVLFGLYVLFSTVISIVQTFHDIAEKRPFAASLLYEVMALILGILLLFSPFSGLELWIQVLGIYFILAAAGLFNWFRKLDKNKTDE